MAYLAPLRYCISSINSGKRRTPSFNRVLENAVKDLVAKKL